jgi:hypothetical protein
MNRSALVVVSILLSLMSLATFGSSRHHSEKFTVVGIHINPERSPKSIPDTLNECIHEPICKKVVDAVSAYAGVDSSMITGAIATTEINRAGQETQYILRLPQGYEYCHAAVHTRSVNKPDDQRSPFMQVTATPSGVMIFTWTPEYNLGEGRSWVDADITVVGVRHDLALKKIKQGGCKRGDNRMFVNCRGTRGFHHNQVPCGDFKD